MAGDSHSSRGTILITGFVSLVVGVVGGVAVNHLTERRPGLTYDLLTPATFMGERESIGVVVLTISNPADKESEDVVGELELRDVDIRDVKVVGLQQDGYKKTVTGRLLTIRVPFLNPGEHFTVNVLVSPRSPNISTERISVRAKGAVGVQQSASNAKAGPIEILSTVAAVLMSLLTVAFTRAVLQGRSIIPLRLRLGRVHNDDQRDILAFVFGIHGFHAEAEIIRNSLRERTYWSECDSFVERVLRVAHEKHICMRAIRCLEGLLGYAWIAPSSKLLIHYNIARLAAAADDKETSKAHLDLAKRKGDKVIRMRIQLRSASN